MENQELIDFCNHLNTYAGLEDLRFDFMLQDYFNAKKHNMKAEDLLDKISQDEGFGNWETVVLNCHHSVIRSVAIAAVIEALRQPPIVGHTEKCNGCEESTGQTKLWCCNHCGKRIEDF